MKIEELSIFGLYSQKENKVTAALLQVLGFGGSSLLHWILSEIGGNLVFNTIESIESQPAQEGTGSIPDGKIICDNFTLFIESKLGCGISEHQLKCHGKLLKDKQNYLVYVTNNPNRPKELPVDVLWMNWEAVVARFEAYQTADKVLEFLISQFCKLVRSQFKESNYYKQKGVLRVSDDVKVRSMTDAYNIFDAEIVNHGFLVAGAANIPYEKGFEVWCSRKGSTQWDNQLSPDGNTFYEGIKKGTDASEHVEKCKAKGFKRIAFYRDEDRFHDSAYHFIGVYELDEKLSLSKKKCVWNRKKTEWYLKK